MSHRTEWKTEDFDVMSWHDVHVHGFRLAGFDPDEGTAELVFDIDYILEWLNNDGAFSFVVSQASLQFHEVFGLPLSLDYTKPTAGMCPFSLAGVERESITCSNGHVSYKWRLVVNWPSGQIEFDSPGFTQRLVGQVYTQPGQGLEPSQRSAA